MGEMGIPKDSAAGRKEFERRMEARRWEDQPEQWKGVRRGWCLGDAAFRKELLAQMAERAGASHYGQELRECAPACSGRLCASPTGLPAGTWHPAHEIRLDAAPVTALQFGAQPGLAETFFPSRE